VPSGPKFDCIARGSLKLNDVGGLVGSFDLTFTGVGKLLSLVFFVLCYLITWSIISEIIFEFH